MSQNRIEYLDGWRGIAILAVLISHFFSIDSFYAGRFGVDIFFVLSGMLMSNILFVKRTNLKLFYWRRGSRILPVFLFYVFTVYLVSYFYKVKFSFIEFFSTVSFFRTYFPTDIHIWKSNVPVGHIWSLNVEEHSYIILSLLTLLLFIRKKEGYALIFLGILTTTFIIIYDLFPEYAPYKYHIRTECAAGSIFLSAGYFLVKHNFSKFINPYAPVFTFVLAIISYTHLVPSWSRLIVAPYLLAFTVNHLSDVPEGIKTALSTKPICYLGIWSYSLYLWQEPFYKMKDSIPGPIGLLLALVTGILSFYYFENPTRDWLNSRYISKNSLHFNNSNLEKTSANNLINTGGN